MKVRLKEVTGEQVGRAHRWQWGDEKRTYYFAYAAGRYRGNVMFRHSDTDTTMNGWYLEIKDQHWYGYPKFEMLAEVLETRKLRHWKFVKKRTYKGYAMHMPTKEKK